MSTGIEQTKKFEPKQPVQLAPPKDRIISPKELAKCDGKQARAVLPTQCHTNDSQELLRTIRPVLLSKFVLLSMLHLSNAVP